MYYFLGYNKDADRYDELVTVKSHVQLERRAQALQRALACDELRDADNEPYDWIELWDDEDDNGVNDIIICADSMSAKI